MKKELSRRDILRYAAAGSLAGMAGCAAPSILRETAKPSRMPAVFLSHGSPSASLEKNAYVTALRRMGEELPLPKAVVVLSAHWQEDAPIRVTGSEKPPLVYDFFGFPDDLYKIQYPAPGHPKVAAQIVSLLSAAGIPAQLDMERGYDHGSWVPMRFAYPGADVPMLQVTFGWDATATELMKMGEALAPLRDQGVLLLGSGGWIHNGDAMRRRGDGQPELYAFAFDTWMRERLEDRNIRELADYKNLAPEWNRCHPTTEHFDTLFFALGASTDKDKLIDIYESGDSSFSLRTFRFG